MSDRKTNVIPYNVVIEHGGVTERLRVAADGPLTASASAMGILLGRMHIVSATPAAPDMPALLRARSGHHPRQPLRLRH